MSYSVWLGQLRIDLLMVDQMREQPEYVGQWHIFLPSDVLLVLHSWRIVWGNPKYQYVPHKAVAEVSKIGNL